MLKAALFFATVFDFSAAASEMERAVIAGDEATLQRLADDFAARLDDDEVAHDTRLPYAYAYVNWRLAAFHERESDPSKRLLKIAEKQLKEILEGNPRDAEAQALYGTVNGWLITSMWSGMRRGPRSNKAYERAREADPENPRVALHEGMSRLFRPGAFGGGVDKAEADLRRALALAEKEPRDEPWPNGGHAEILAWMGQVMVKKGDLEKARAFYDEALELEPGYHWVNETLLPELEAEIAADGAQNH